ncbi:hypothetical protein BGW80DRAFT_1360723 [Lactifluus volemus]|nr:hypothetical protein BGW80DRAFT_1360723 [Lactifluus volemus]
MFSSALRYVETVVALGILDRVHKYADLRDGHCRSYRRPRFILVFDLVPSHSNQVRLGARQDLAHNACSPRSMVFHSGNRSLSTVPVTVLPSLPRHGFPYEITKSHKGMCRQPGAECGATFRRYRSCSSAAIANRNPSGLFMSSCAEARLVPGRNEQKQGLTDHPQPPDLDPNAIKLPDQVSQPTRSYPGMTGVMVPCEQHTC